ncbi:MAG: multicopper oxidase domain-containing protein [Solirubrobacterales bacterium]
MERLTRRNALTAAIPLAATPFAVKAALAQDSKPPAHGEPGHNHATDHGQVDATKGGGHAGATFKQGGTVDHAANGFDPTDILRDFDYGKTRRLASGKVLREWTLIAQDKEIEVTPGVKYAAWTYNGRVPGPTLRAREGEKLRVRFVNASEHPHTVHFHGIHTAAMDGVPGLGAGLLQQGEETTYEFDAEPFGCHLYHCHSAPLAEHIVKGLYGGFIIDPRDDTRPEADEMVMVLNGFDTNFDEENEVYAANTVGFHYMENPIKVKRDELLRIYLINVTEFDPINSLHVHANFFEWYPTGTSLRSSELTDTIMLCQGQRGIAEMRFKFPGKYMFHAHQSEFAELGWMSFFEVS